MILYPYGSDENLMVFLVTWNYEVRFWSNLRLCNI